MPRLQDLQGDCHRHARFDVTQKHYIPRLDAGEFLDSWGEGGCFIEQQMQTLSRNPFHDHCGCESGSVWFAQCRDNSIIVPRSSVCIVGGVDLVPPQLLSQRMQLGSGGAEIFFMYSDMCFQTHAFEDQSEIGTHAGADQ